MGVYTTIFSCFKTLRLGEHNLYNAKQIVYRLSIVNKLSQPTTAGMGHKTADSAEMSEFNRWHQGGHRITKG